ncbi:hypothetical protein [Erwinia tasmaniensis]|uniref:hypothetical protein n=1 Tax=Erwinia tasmaniensis TaxID=338565 RepID=UPI003A4D8563
MPAKVIFSEQQALAAAHAVAALPVSDAATRDRLYPLEALLLFSRPNHRQRALSEGSGNL